MYRGGIPLICHGSHEYTRVNFFWPVWIFTDLTRKIGIFGVNFILQKFCPCKKNEKYQVWFWSLQNQLLSPAFNWTETRNHDRADNSKSTQYNMLWLKRQERESCIEKKTNSRRFQDFPWLSKAKVFPMPAIHWTTLFSFDQEGPALPFLEE